MDDKNKLKLKKKEDKNAIYLDICPGAGQPTRQLIGRLWERTSISQVVVEPLL